MERAHLVELRSFMVTQNNNKLILMEKDNRRLILGSIFIVLGTLFLLDNLRILEFRIPDFLWRWEMILITIGIVNILTRNYSAAFILIGIGGFFWTVDEYHINFWDLWPVILILIGVSFILKQGVFNSEKKKLTEDQ